MQNTFKELLKRKTFHTVARLYLSRNSAALR